MVHIKQEMDAMRKDPSKRTQDYFDKVIEMSNIVRMYIMYGLQKRKMLVRESDTEPRGQDSIEHWDKKAIFQKGGLKVAGKRYQE